MVLGRDGIRIRNRKRKRWEQRKMGAEEGWTDGRWHNGVIIRLGYAIWTRSTVYRGSGTMGFIASSTDFNGMHTIHID